MEEESESFEILSPFREGLGRYISRWEDGSKVRGRRGAKHNLNHNSTKYKFIRRTYSLSKSKLQEEVTRNFIIS